MAGTLCGEGRPARCRRSPRFPGPTLPLLLCLACGGDGSGTDTDPEWLTELEYRFTGTAEAGVLFNRAYLRADPRRDRIFIVDPRETQVSAWHPDGSLVFVVGRRGEGPGEFTQPSRIHFAKDGGFTVREGWGTRFTHYTADGELVGTEIGLTTSLTYPYPPEAKAPDFRGFGKRGIDRALLHAAQVGLEAPADDGGYLARPRFPARVRAGLYGGAPMEREPLLRVRRSESGQWRVPEPIFWVNIRNRQHVVPVEHLDSHSFGGQYFGDADRTAFALGKILVMRRAGGPPGSLDLLELNADGDTLWKRRLQFDPLKLTPEWVHEVVDRFTGAGFQLPGSSQAQRTAYVEAFEESLYKPEHLPAAQSFFLAASDDVWIRTFERSDTFRVYYTIPRGDLTGDPERVLLPEGFGAADATATHVWGIRDDALGVPYVVGRRLVAPAG